MPRLLYVVNNPSFFVSHRLALARAVRQHGYEVHVATPAGPAAAQIEAEGLEFHALGMDRGSMAPLSELRSFLSLFRLYRRLAPDLVHHITIKPVLYGGIAARLLRVPAVVHSITGLGWVFAAPGIRPFLVRQSIRVAYRLALGHRNAKVIFQNPDDLSDFTMRGFVRDDRTALIRGSGVDINEYSPRPEPAGTPMVLLASRMLWEKGIGEFVEAARKLRVGGTPARFVLAGESDPSNPGSIPSETLRSWHEEGIVEWLGHRDDMPAVLAQSHIVCLPSRYGEGVPKILIEAAACGRPIVTTDTPGCREIVRDSQNGILVEEGSVEALAAALKRLIEDAELRARMGQNGHELARTEFTLQRVISETLGIYTELLPAR